MGVLRSNPRSSQRSVPSGKLEMSTAVRRIKSGITKASSPCSLKPTKRNTWIGVKSVVSFIIPPAYVASELLMKVGWLVRVPARRMQLIWSFGGDPYEPTTNFGDPHLHSVGEVSHNLISCPGGNLVCHLPGAEFELGLGRYVFPFVLGSVDIVTTRLKD